MSNDLAYQTYFSFNSTSGDRWGIAHQNGSSGSYTANSVVPYVGTSGVFDAFALDTFTAGQVMSFGMHQPNGTNIQAIKDAGSVQSVNSTKDPAITNLLLGGEISDNSRLMGHIIRFTYYPKRLPNAQLQGLTAS